MCRVLTALCLAGLALTFVACGVRPPPAPGDSQPTVEVTAAQLAQEFTDDQPAASQRYVQKTLVITGTVGRLTKPGRYDLDPGPDDDVDMILFFVTVTNSKTGEQVQSELRCQFRPNLPAARRRSLGLEKGKQVTLRGRYEVAHLDRPVVGFGNCTLERVGGP
jgi:hypothetical protein